MIVAAISFAYEVNFFALEGQELYLTKELTILMLVCFEVLSLFNN